MKDNTRVADIIISLAGLIICLPLFIIIAICIKCNSKGNIFFTQERIGCSNKPFLLFKFRTMVNYKLNKSLLTIGNKDARITAVGYYLRRYKLDELPQLWNVLKGDMSMVGPRPEVQKYVDHYSKEQRKILLVKPGITDYASIHFANESELLASSDDPEKFYIEKILPLKLNLNLRYIHKRNLGQYFKIILLTLFQYPRKTPNLEL